MINTTRGYDLTSEPQTLEALRNVLMLIFWCERKRDTLNLKPCVCSFNFLLTKIIYTQQNLNMHLKSKT